MRAPRFVEPCSASEAELHSARSSCTQERRRYAGCALCLLASVPAVFRVRPHHLKSQVATTARSLHTWPVLLVLLVLVVPSGAGRAFSDFDQSEGQMSAFKSAAQKGAAVPQRPTTNVAGLSINRDLIRYRENYPDQQPELHIVGLTSNLRFYKNEIKSVPDGDLIDILHTKV